MACMRRFARHHACHCWVGHDACLILCKGVQHHVMLYICRLEESTSLFCRYWLSNALLNQGGCHVNDAFLPGVNLEPQLLLHLHQ